MSLDPNPAEVTVVVDVDAPTIKIGKIENGKAWIASVCPGLLNEFVGNRPQEGVRLADVPEIRPDYEGGREEEEAAAELEAELLGHREAAYVRS